VAGCVFIIIMAEETPLVSLEITGPEGFHYDYRSCGKSLPYCANDVTEEAASTNTSFQYSGRHDHGAIALLKDDGYYSSLISALQEMKRETDIVIQEQVALESKGAEKPEIGEVLEEMIVEEGSGNESSSKKPRLHE
jgi:hypothetical protein